MNYEEEYIIVLAGGNDENSEPHDFVKIRLNKAIEIYNNNSNKNIKTKIICLGGGTYHKPPCLNKLNYVVHESTACAIYLVNNGIEEKNIMREWSSYDTIANVFYCMVNFIIPLKITKCHIITSDFHMERSKIIFNYLMGYVEHDINISYISVNDDVIPADILENRKEREKKSAENFLLLTQKIKTLKEFVEWLHCEHDAYKSIVTYYPMDNKLKNTY
jgi:uncharacterized SAM-binding protein YcdF (DUF218 family)